MIGTHELTGSQPGWRRKLRAILGFNQYERDRYVQQWSTTLTPGTRVLDVGAGPCRYRSWFSQCQYFAEDFAQYQENGYGPMAGKGKRKSGQLDMVADAARLPVADGVFEAALCTEVLEHVPEPVAVLKEIGRVLKPRGKLLLTAPLGSGLHQEPYHYYGGFTPHWYRRFLPAAGFANIEVTANGGFFRLYGQESQRFADLLAPGNLPAGAKWLAPFWLLSWPWFRIILPWCCNRLDRLDSYRGFTVGYFITAEKI
jgi:SAM-dependent methyltransferase